jgi:hypothetical protein
MYLETLVELATWSDGGMCNSFGSLKSDQFAS